LFAKSIPSNPQLATQNRPTIAVWVYPHSPNKVCLEKTSAPRAGYKIF